VPGRVGQVAGGISPPVASEQLMGRWVSPVQRSSASRSAGSWLPGRGTTAMRGTCVEPSAIEVYAIGTTSRDAAGRLALATNSQPSALCARGSVVHCTRAPPGSGTDQAP
jgi:hypothetical protein